MKAFAICISLILSGVIAHAQSLKRYNVQSGIIEYELAGAQTGKETIYFTDWGMKEAKITKSEMSYGGFAQQLHTAVIIDGDFVYTLDFASRTGTKSINPILLMVGDENVDLIALGELMMSQMGGEKIGQETVLGKSCDVWEIKQLGSKTWVWNGVTLKTKVDLGMQMNSIAVSISETDVPDEKFEIPSDFVIQEVNQDGLKKN